MSSGSDTPAIGPKLTQLAEKILDELLAVGSDTPLAEQIDALKAIGTLHLGMEKLADRMQPADDTGTTFETLRRRVATSEEGTA